MINTCSVALLSYKGKKIVQKELFKVHFLSIFISFIKSFIKDLALDDTWITLYIVIQKGYEMCKKYCILTSLQLQLTWFSAFNTKHTYDHFFKLN